MGSSATFPDKRSQSFQEVLRTLKGLKKRSFVTGNKVKVPIFPWIREAKICQKHLKIINIIVFTTAFLSSFFVANLEGCHLQNHCIWLAFSVTRNSTKHFAKISGWNGAFCQGMRKEALSNVHKSKNQQAQLAESEPNKMKTLSLSSKNIFPGIAELPEKRFGFSFSICWKTWWGSGGENFNAVLTRSNLQKEKPGSVNF